MELECRKYYICRWVTFAAYIHIQAYEMKEGYNRWVAGVCHECDPADDHGLLSNHYVENGGTDNFRERNLFRRIDLHRDLYEKQLNLK